jgi:hypothetical protein
VRSGCWAVRRRRPGPAVEPTPVGTRARASRPFTWEFSGRPSTQPGRRRRLRSSPNHYVPPSGVDGGGPRCATVALVETVPGCTAPCVIARVELTTACALRSNRLPGFPRCKHASVGADPLAHKWARASTFQTPRVSQRPARARPAGGRVAPVLFLRRDPLVADERGSAEPGSGGTPRRRQTRLVEAVAGILARARGRSSQAIALYVHQGPPQVVGATRSSGTFAVSDSLGHDPAGVVRSVCCDVRSSFRRAVPANKPPSGMRAYAVGGPCLDDDLSWPARAP